MQPSKMPQVRFCKRFLSCFLGLFIIVIEKYIVICLVLIDFFHSFEPPHKVMKEGFLLVIIILGRENSLQELLAAAMFFRVLL